MKKMLLVILFLAGVGRLGHLFCMKDVLPVLPDTRALDMFKEKIKQARQKRIVDKLGNWRHIPTAMHNIVYATPSVILMGCAARLYYWAHKKGKEAEKTEQDSAEAPEQEGIAESGEKEPGIEKIVHPLSDDSSAVIENGSIKAEKEKAKEEEGKADKRRIKSVKFLAAALIPCALSFLGPQLCTKGGERDFSISLFWQLLPHFSIFAGGVSDYDPSYLFDYMLKKRDYCAGTLKNYSIKRLLKRLHLDELKVDGIVEDSEALEHYFKNQLPENTQWVIHEQDECQICCENKKTLVGHVYGNCQGMMCCACLMKSVLNYTGSAENYHCVFCRTEIAYETVPLF